MSTAKRQWLALVVAGGLLVLASYAYGVAVAPAGPIGIWGGVPEAWKPIYTVNMLLAAAGFFGFFQHLLRCDSTARARLLGRLVGFEELRWIFAAVLIPSALWLPLTHRMLAAPNDWLWLAIVAVLACVGAGAVALLVVVARIEPSPGRRSRAVAVVGAVPFALQTAVLDAIVWPVFFPR